MIPKSNTRYTYEEFLEITKDVERVEFIDGEIIYMSSRSIEHQMISMNLSFALKNFFNKSQCKVLCAPLDVVLEDEEKSNNKSVQPDIMVICSESKLTGSKYIGVPKMIIEILSPTNSTHDTLTKLNLYQRFKVPEYWIVSPKNKSVTVYKYDDSIQAYDEFTIYIKDVVNSETFKELTILLKEIFE